MRVYVGGIYYVGVGGKPNNRNFREPLLYKIRFTYIYIVLRTTNNCVCVGGYILCGVLDGLGKPK